MPLHIEAGLGCFAWASLKASYKGRFAGCAQFVFRSPALLALLIHLELQVSQWAADGWGIVTGFPAQATMDSTHHHRPRGGCAIQVPPVRQFLQGEAGSVVARLQPGCGECRRRIRGGDQARYRPTDQGPVF